MNLHEIRKVYRNSRNDSLYSTQIYRLLPDLNAPLDNIRLADYNTWVNIGFGDLLRSGLGVEITKTHGYTIIAMAKNAPETYYDLLFICLPTDKTTKIQHTPNNLPQEVWMQFYESLNIGIDSILKIATEKNDQIKRFMIHHHVGPYEIHNHPHSNSFPQWHMHLVGISDKDTQYAQQHPMNGEKNRWQRHIFKDPTIHIVYDLCQSFFGREVELDTDASRVILKRRNGDTTAITSDEYHLLVQIYTMWQEKWAELAACFCYTEASSGFKKNILPKEVRQERLLEFLQKYENVFGPESLLVLEWLAEYVKNKDQVNHIENTFYNGIAGAIGWVLDQDTNQALLVFAPRLFVSDKKIADKYYLSHKDRSQYFPKSELEMRIEYQTLILRQMERKIMLKKSNFYE